MKFKNQTIIDRLAGLRSLNGCNRVIETEGKATSSVFETYRGFSAQTKVNIKRDVSILVPLADNYEEARKELVKELTPEGGVATDIDASPVLLAQYRERNAELLQALQPVAGLLQIPWAEIDAAKVDSGTIVNLGSLIKGMPAANDADLLPESESDEPAEEPANPASPSQQPA